MSDPVKDIVEQVKKTAARPTVSTVFPDGYLVEMVYRPTEHKTLFCIGKDGEYRYERELIVNGDRLVPYSPKNNLLRHEVVLFASEAAPYESEQVLVEEIRAFIHRYADVSPLFEEMASYYVLFTWLYDSFNELPYLRFRGDTGSGKTRCLMTVGALCYKPIFASGASTVSPLFRILDAVRGTLIIDEGDFRFSDEKAEVIKILNNGNARGFPVLRSESVSGREFSPRAYSVFGPKLVATRGYFEDRALESRCLTEDMGGRRLRDNIPLNLTGSYQEEARALRNKLLMFRFRNFNKPEINSQLVDRNIEPRLNQIFIPLLSIIEDLKAQEQLRGLLRHYHEELVAERGLDSEAQALEVIQSLLLSSDTKSLSIADITSRFADIYSDDYDRKITNKWVGYLVRRRLGLKTQRSSAGYIIVPSQFRKLRSLYEKYGLEQTTAEQESQENSVESNLQNPPLVNL